MDSLILLKQKIIVTESILEYGKVRDLMVEKRNKAFVKIVLGGSQK